jgi:hypothetical protein
MYIYIFIHIYIGMYIYTVYVFISMYIYRNPARHQETSFGDTSRANQQSINNVIQPVKSSISPDYLSREGRGAAIHLRHKLPQALWQQLVVLAAEKAATIAQPAAFPREHGDAAVGRALHQAAGVDETWPRRDCCRAGDGSTVARRQGRGGAVALARHSRGAGCNGRQ